MYFLYLKAVLRRAYSPAFTAYCCSNDDNVLTKRDMEILSLDLNFGSLKTSYTKFELPVA